VRRMLHLAMALGLTFVGLGCATALNLQDASLRKPYGGVTMPILEFFGNNESSEYAAVFFWPWWLIDKPLSLVGDTLSLPYLLATRQNAQPAGRQQSPQPSQPAP
jgi:uncharacterized protein YceK